MRSPGTTNFLYLSQTLLCTYLDVIIRYRRHCMVSINLLSRLKNICKVLHFMPPDTMYFQQMEHKSTRKGFNRLKKALFLVDRFFYHVGFMRSYYSSCHVVTEACVINSVAGRINIATENLHHLIKTNFKQTL